MTLSSSSSVSTPSSTWTRSVESRSWGGPGGPAGGSLRRIGPTTRGTTSGRPPRLGRVPGLSRSMPSRAVATRLLTGFGSGSSHHGHGLGTTRSAHWPRGASTPAGLADCDLTTRNTVVRCSSHATRDHSYPLPCRNGGLFQTNQHNAFGARP
jgi:hypothetical protein